MIFWIILIKSMNNFLFLVLIILLALNASALHSMNHQAQQISVCTIQSQVGVIYNQQENFPICGFQMVKIKNKCLRQCPIGSPRIGDDCYSRCPDSTWVDKGLTCAMQYGRGKGFPKKAGEQTDEGMINRCQKDNGQNNCEKFETLYFPKCKSGYEAYQCCLCRLQIKCPQHRLTQNDPYTCNKDKYEGQPVALSCLGYFRVYDAGLCYPQCRQGTNIGPLCLKDNFKPKDWIKCDGLLYTKSSAICDKHAQKSISQIGALALTLVTTFQPQLSKMDKDYGKLYQLSKSFNQLRQLTKDNEGFQKIFEKFSKGKFPLMRRGKNYDEVLGVYGATESAPFISGEDMVRLSEQVAAVVSLELKETYTACSKMN